VALMETEDWLADARTSYDTVADNYADHVRATLDGQPYIRAALALLADSVHAGSMTDLPLADASVAGLIAFWSLIHVPDHALPKVLGHFRRALRPGAPLLLGFHVGDTSRLKTSPERYFSRAASHNSARSSRDKRR
jgi:hypothetical protein